MDIRTRPARLQDIEISLDIRAIWESKRVVDKAVALLAPEMLLLLLGSGCRAESDELDVCAVAEEDEAIFCKAVSVFASRRNGEEVS